VVELGELKREKVIEFPGQNPTSQAPLVNKTGVKIKRKRADFDGPFVLTILSGVPENFLGVKGEID